MPMSWKRLPYDHSCKHTDCSPRSLTDSCVLMLCCTQRGRERRGTGGSNTAALEPVCSLKGDRSPTEWLSSPAGTRLACSLKSNNGTLAREASAPAALGTAARGPGGEQSEMLCGTALRRAGLPWLGMQGESGSTSVQAQVDFRLHLLPSCLAWFKILSKWGIVLCFKGPICTGVSQQIKGTLNTY